MNPVRTAVLYASRDGADWATVVRARKDVYPFLFQFGTFVLPKALHDAPRGIISGQALTRHDDRISLLTFGAAQAEG
ncbi:MAG: hypothetical protein EXR47_03410 [Dehalococcoidia bacterium]|nr:hypothetical protein [Dehalococcoidia bacterium]